jgi:hypothetical protein
MFRVYLLYVERNKRQNSRWSIIHKYKAKESTCMFGHTYMDLLACHRKPICRHAFYDLKIF